MAHQVINVLFLCTSNSARSILAESLLNHWGRGRFHAFSAGSQPATRVHPLALELMQRFRLPIRGVRCKSWDEFTGADAPRLGFVFTVCDRILGEPCPIWPGQPMGAHWGVADPVAVVGDEIYRLQAFRRAFRELERRIKLFVSLPFDRLRGRELGQRLEAIGRHGGITEGSDFGAPTLPAS